MSHTPEPWVHAFAYLVEDEGGNWIATCPAGGQGAANMRRLVAAVNACKDIPTEALEAGVITELLAACEAALDEMAGTPLGETVRDMLRAAEAKAKGEEK